MGTVPLYVRADEGDHGLGVVGAPLHARRQVLEDLRTRERLTARELVLELRQDLLPQRDRDAQQQSLDRVLHHAASSAARWRYRWIDWCPIAASRRSRVRPSSNARHARRYGTI